MVVEVAGVLLRLTVATNVYDDSETLEFRTHDPVSYGANMVAGVTCFDCPESPLLIHIPDGIEESLLRAILDFSRTWFAKNLPYTRIAG